MLRSVNISQSGNKELWAGLLLGILSVIPLLISGEYGFIVLPVVILILLTMNFGFKGLFFISLIILIAVPDGIIDSFREIAQVSSFLLVFGLYLLKEGITIPKLLIEDKTLTKVFFLSVSIVLFSALFSISITKSFPHFIRYLLFVFFFIVIVYHATQMKLTIVITVAMTVIGVIGGLGSFIGFIINPNVVELLLTMGTVQEGGIFGNRAALGGQLTMATASTLYLIYTVNNKYRGYLYFALFWILIGFFLANSRGAIIGVIVLVVTFLFLNDRKKFYKLISIFFGIYLFFLFNPDFEHFINSYFRANRIGENTRFALWEFTWTAFLDNPFFGVGPGMIKYSFVKYLNVSLISFDGAQFLYLFEKANLGHAHNFILFTLSESGIAGLMGVVAFISFFYYRSFNLFKLSENVAKEVSILGGTCLAALTGMLSRGMVESTGILTFGWLTRDLMLWLWLALAIVGYNQYYLKNPHLEQKS